MKMTAVAKHQTHSFENKCAIVAPLIGIFRPKQAGDAGPVFLFDFVKKTLDVPIDLALRLPQPEAIQTALAVFVGLLLSLAAGRVLAQILYQVSPTDPFALIASSLMLAAAALLACFLPARRATYVNPITALRTE